MDFVAAGPSRDLSPGGPRHGCNGTDIEKGPSDAEIAPRVPRPLRRSAQHRPDVGVAGLRREHADRDAAADRHPDAGPDGDEHAEADRHHGRPRMARRHAASGRRRPAAPPNPVAVTSAYANLQKLDSYHLEIKADGVGSCIPLGIRNNLTYMIDANSGNQQIMIDDGPATKQEGYKVGGKIYLVQNGQVTEATSLPLLFTLPELLYTSLTAPGAMTFTAAGNEQINGRATTKYNGTGADRAPRVQPDLRLALPARPGRHHRADLGRHARATSWSPAT